MRISNTRSPGKQMKREDYDELLSCRMSMLGLDFFAIEGGNGDTLEEIVGRCASCSVRDACAVDLKRDPNNPVWETYCPNVGALLGIAEASWQTR